MLSADIKKEAVLQKFKLPIVVQTNLEPPLDSLEISLEGEIVPAIAVEPTALIFSDQSRGQPKTIVAKSIVPSLRLPEPQIHVKSNASLLCDTKRINDQELSIEIRLDAGSSLGTFASSIVLDFGEEGTVCVPVIYQASIEAAK